MAKRESCHYPFGRRRPWPIVEAIHRWWHRRQYAMLPEFYRDFYPFNHALSLSMQYVRHELGCAKTDMEHARQCINRTVDLEKTITELRLALAMARSGWNEDQVDQFMGMWFKRHDLPAPQAAPDAAEGGGA